MIKKCFYKYDFYIKKRSTKKKNSDYSSAYYIKSLVN